MAKPCKVKNLLVMMLVASLLRMPSGFRSSLSSVSKTLLCGSLSMSSSSAVMEPIGIIRSPYSERFGTPRQPTVTEGVLGGGAMQGTIELFEGSDYENAIDSLDGFDYIWVIAWLNRCIPKDKNNNKGWRSRVRPRMRPPGFLNSTVGVLSTRAPHRPNPIGLSALRLTGVDKSRRILHVEGLDFLDGTPVLDIKPYIPVYDSFPNARIGWLTGGLPTSTTDTVPVAGAETSGGGQGTWGNVTASQLQRSVNAPDYSPHSPPHKSALQKLCHERYANMTTATTATSDVSGQSGSSRSSSSSSVWKDPLYIWSDGFKVLTVQLPDKKEFSFPVIATATASTSSSNSSSDSIAAADNSIVTTIINSSSSSSGSGSEEAVLRKPESPVKIRKRHEQYAAKEVLQIFLQEARPL